MDVRAISEKLVSKQKQITPTGATAAKDPVSETKGWATYEKKVPIEAKRADKGGTLRTLEGPACYSSGDMIARGAKGEKWPIRRDVFGKTYSRIGMAHGFAKAAAFMAFSDLDKYSSRANVKDGRVSSEDAHEAAEAIGAKGKVDEKQLRRGMAVELEHQADPRTDVVKGNPKTLGRIAWAHLNERSDYYDMLDKAEKSASAAERYAAIARRAGRRGSTSNQFGALGPRVAAAMGSRRSKSFNRRPLDLLTRSRSG